MRELDDAKAVAAGEPMDGDARNGQPRIERGGRRALHVLEQIDRQLGNRLEARVAERRKQVAQRPIRLRRERDEIRERESGDGNARRRGQRPPHGVAGALDR